MSAADAAKSNVQDIYVELIPLTYSGAVPTPTPPCPDPTPDEQYRQALAQRQEVLKQKEEARQQQQQQQQQPAAVEEGQQPPRQAPAPESLKNQLAASASEVYANFRGAFSQAVMSIEKGATVVSTRTETQVRQLEYQHNCETFRRDFPDLAQQGEVLLAHYGCSVMHGGLQVKGHIQITRHHLCFYAETSSAIAKATEAFVDAFNAARQAATKNQTSAEKPPQQRLVGIKQVIPLSEIACVLPSVALDTIGGEAPFFLPLPAPTVRATALQVYATNGNKLFQFLSFDSLISHAAGALSDSVKGTALDRALNYLDHAWREAVEVPLKDVEYA